MSARPAVFLDRDGTVIEDIGYLARPEQVKLYPWSVDAVRLLNRAGLPVIITTNQSGVARGLFTEAVIEDVHQHLSDILRTGGAHIDGYYYCPHHPDGRVDAYAYRCHCRKPEPGLIARAARDRDLDPSRSVVVGDKWVDVRLARAVGAQAVLVRTGYGVSQELHPPPDVSADRVADNLMAAVSWILSRLSTGP